ncbi:MAG: helix-turn-helix transcriptional regulator [Rubrivivax sp.]|nr:helix-turn-helix transcriptional regulator [Rubrivivax sp.]
MADDLDQRVARRVRELRARRGLSLQALAAGSGVSRSMISVIERGEVHATAVVLERLATGLGVTLASLFDETAQARATTPVARAAEQPPWRDPASGYVRRNVSPAGAGSPIQIVDVSFPPGATVAYETGDREPPVHQQIWVLEGRIDVAWGDERHRLEAGDCYALRLDRPLSYHNPTRKPARYAVVLVQPGALPDRERT